MAGVGLGTMAELSSIPTWGWGLRSGPSSFRAHSLHELLEHQVVVELHARYCLGARIQE